MGARQRGDPRGEGLRSARPASSRRRDRRPTTSPARPSRRLALEDAVRAGRRRAARPDRDPRRRGPRGRGPGGQARAAPGRDHGVVWRDFKPGGGTPGEVESGELGLPGVTVDLRRPGGETVETRHNRGRRHLRVRGASRTASTASRSASSTFATPFAGRHLARREADHAGDHDRLPLDLGRLRDGRDRGRARGDPARHARGGAHRRRHRVAGLPPRHRARCSRRC